MRDRSLDAAQSANSRSDALVDSVLGDLRRGLQRIARTFPINLVLGLVLYAAHCADTALRQHVVGRRITLPQAQRSTAWAFVERFEVPDYDNPERTYLTRWRLIQTPWASIYLHRFDGPDPRLTLHDHPWPFVSLVLRGGYRECRDYGSPSVAVRHLNVKRATDMHTIVRLLRHPTWTLMLVGRRQRDWGYLDEDGTWTRFDQHEHAREFDAAMQARAAMRPDGSWIDPATGGL